MLRKTTILAASALMALSAGAAYAQRMPGGSQQLCAPRAALVEKLKAEFDEEPESVGVTHSGGLFEVLASSSGTWTVLATGPNGVSCLVLSGDGWMSKERNATEKAQGAAKKIDM